MEYILIIMMFTHDGGAHSQQVVFDDILQCQTAKIKLTGSAENDRGYYSGYVKAECIHRRKQDES